MNILVSMNENLRAMFFSDDIYDSLKDIGNVTYNDTGKNYNQEELKEQLADKDVIITGWGHTKITPQIAGERLKFVVHTGGTLGPIIDSGLYDIFNRHTVLFKQRRRAGIQMHPIVQQRALALEPLRRSDLIQ